MKIIICNNYDSCVHASITVLDGDRLIDINPKKYLVRNHCELNIFAVAKDYGGEDFLLLEYIDGDLNNAYRINDQKLKENQEIV